MIFYKRETGKKWVSGQTCQQVLQVLQGKAVEVGVGLVHLNRVHGLVVQLLHTLLGNVLGQQVDRLGPDQSKKAWSALINIRRKSALLSFLLIAFQMTSYRKRHLTSSIVHGNLRIKDFDTLLRG